MHIHLVTPCVLTFVSLAALPALADGELPDPTSSVHFPTLGADGIRSSINARVGIVDFPGDEQPLHFELGGQFVGPTGLGGYGRIGASTLDGRHALGAPEVGVLYHWADARNQTGVTLRGGIVLPTFGNDKYDIVYAYDTVVTRPSDSVTAISDTLSVRLGFAPTWRRGNVVLRGDAGLDLLSGDTVNEDLLLHLDVGIGITSGKAALVAELSNLFIFGEGELLHVAAISGEYTSGIITAVMTITRPLGSELEDLDATGFIAGVRAAL